MTFSRNIKDKYNININMIDIFDLNIFIFHIIKKNINTFYKFITNFKNN
jgi:hypothetical protein